MISHIYWLSLVKIDIYRSYWKDDYKEMLNSSLDINAMDMNSLSKLILSDHEILKDLDENVLCEMVNKMNPYSKVVGGNSK